MTGRLRKRHFIIWILLLVVGATLLVYARMNTPKYQGDTKMEVVK